MKDKRKILTITGVVLAVIMIMVAIFLIVNQQNNKKSNNKKDGPKHSITEQIKNNYDFTKEDAIAVVKTVFHSDNYTFEAEANKDSLYVVTVTNTLTNKKYIYYVDPATKTYKIDESTM